MRNLSLFLILIITGALSATSIVIERTEGPDISCSTADIEDISFTDDAVGVDVASIEYLTTDFQLQTNTSTTLTAVLLDLNGNIVDTDQDVTFIFVWEPTPGTNINDEADAVDEYVTVTPENGIVSATLNVGDPGLTSISVRTADYLGSTIEENRIVTIFTNAFNVVGLVDAPFSGTNCGAGMWRVTVSAICSNDLGMASPSDVPCLFSFVDETIDWANIDGDAYTGNENYEGQSYAGVAFTDLDYHGSHSLDKVAIQCVVDGITIIDTVQLPLNDPAISMTLDPGNLAWTTGMDENDELIGEVEIHVHDGQGNAVSGAVFNLISTRGDFVEPDEQYQVPGENYNVIQSVYGVAVGKIRLRWFECPPVDPPPNQISVDITAFLESHQLTATATLIVLNYN